MRSLLTVPFLNARNAGSADKLYVEYAIEALKRYKGPEVTNTKAIDCSIKWAS